MSLGVHIHSTKFTEAIGLKKLLSFLSVLIVALVLVAGCQSDETSDKSENGDDGIKEFTAFIAVPGTELPDDNRMLNKIAEKIGAKADVKWLTGQTAKERIGVMIAGGEYPDFVDASDGTPEMVEAGAFVPLDDYIDDYPNIKNLFTEQEWNLIRSAHGKIYYIPQFGVVKGEYMRTQHNGEAFWIQKRVLKWAGYPEITTLDEYFDLIEAYLEANPESEDGQKNIGFAIITDDWRYFALENPPQFLAGYPNDGKAIVDPETLEAKVYDTIPEAKIYFKKLNEMYNKGIIDPETFTMNYDQYLAKISSGRVLGMVDQYWQFSDAENSLRSQGMDDRTYVPLDLVIDPNVTPQYLDKPHVNPARGLGITVSCEDVEGALQFLNDLLDPEVMIMRYWGEEGVDYEVDENGRFYRTEEQRANHRDTNWVTQNKADYNYFPTYEGLIEGTQNAVHPSEQPEEFWDSLTDIDREVLEAYGYEKWTDFLTPVEENKPWYPIYSAVDSWTADTPEGIAAVKMDEVKKQWLPKVIMAPTNEFEREWEEYMTVYHNEVDIEAYEKALTEEVRRRVEAALGN